MGIPNTTNTREGGTHPGTVTGFISEKFGDRQITVDADHPLASKVTAEFVAPKTKKEKE